VDHGQPNPIRLLLLLYRRSLEGSHETAGSRPACCPCLVMRSYCMLGRHRLTQGPSSGLSCSSCWGGFTFLERREKDRTSHFALVLRWRTDSLAEQALTIRLLEIGSRLQPSTASQLHASISSAAVACSKWMRGRAMGRLACVTCIIVRLVSDACNPESRCLG